MLNAYISQVQRLLHDPSAALYTTTDLTAYINEARRQLAMESQSCRALATYSLSSSPVAFSAVTPPVTVQSLLDIRQIAVSGSLIPNEPWEWFVSYYLESPGTGTPARWAQFADGVSGSFYVAPVPASPLTITIDGVWLPLDLTSDATAEALPIPWQDAVKYFAAYLAYMNSQRASDADRMMRLFEAFSARARAMSRPTVTPSNMASDWSGQQGA